MKEVVREIKDLAAMRALAEETAELAAKSSKIVLLLDGPMGAGKTQFTRFLVEALGSSETCSPSFAIHNSYLTPRGNVEHFDLFRLESEDDLESTGFWDFFQARKGIVVIEWAEKLGEFGMASQLPVTWPKRTLVFENLGGETRRVLIRYAD